MMAESSELRWRVQLAGDKSVAAVMARVFTGSDPSVSQGEDGQYYLRWSGWQEHSDALEIVNAAAPVLARLCGVLNLSGVAVGEVWAKSAELVDGAGRRIRSGGILARMHGTVSRPETLEELAAKGGPSDRSLADRLQELAKVDPTARALFELASWRQLGWGDLYMIFELLRKAAGSEAKLADLAGSTPEELERLRRTANLYRHASINGPKDFERLPLHEAIPLTRALVRSWLHSKL